MIYSKLIILGRKKAILRQTDPPGYQWQPARLAIFCPIIDADPKTLTKKHFDECSK